MDFTQVQNVPISESLYKDNDSIKDFLTEIEAPTPEKNESFTYEQEVPKEPINKAVEQKPDEDVVKISSALTSDLIIYAIDGVQTFALNKAHSLKLSKKIGKENIEKAFNLFDLYESNNLKLHDQTEDDTIAIKSIERFKLKTERVPFSKDEVDKLKPILTEIIKKQGGELTPTQALLLMGFQIMIPRLTDLFVN